MNKFMTSFQEKMDDLSTILQQPPDDPLIILHACNTGGRDTRPITLPCTLLNILGFLNMLTYTKIQWNKLNRLKVWIKFFWLKDSCIISGR
jgi:hypothetical protein